MKKHNYRLFSSEHHPASPMRALGAMLILFFLLCPARQAMAGVHDGSEKGYRSRLIDHRITPEMVQELSKKADAGSAQAAGAIRDAAGGTVFWRGRVTHFLNYPGNFWIRVSPDRGAPFWVFAKKSIRNLDFDRQGYLIGVKGNVIPKDNRLHYLKAISVVLVAPPPGLSLATFREKYFPGRDKNDIHSFITHRIYMHNPHYAWADIQKIASAIIKSGERHGLDPLLLTALINIESAFDVDAVSSSGALGLGQLMPFTAKDLGVNPEDPVQNVGGAAKYLGTQMRRWGGSSDPVALALASYNAGPGAVSRHGGIPPYSETQNYVFFIKLLRKEYQRQLEESAPAPAAPARGEGTGKGP
jgi:hypothetical protein